MAERPLDRLLPGAVALVFGAAALAAGLGGIAADLMMGRPSPTSGVGFVLMLPLAVFAAIVGFAIGYGAGAWAKSHGVNTLVPMRPYRIAMALALVVATVIGATLGARPVIRNERLYRARVISGEGAMLREPGYPRACAQLPVVVCSQAGIAGTGSFLSSSGEIDVRCSRGLIRLTRASGDVAGSLDVSDYRQIGDTRAGAVKLQDGREAFAVLSAVRGGSRHMLAVFNQDGQAVYQELIDGSAREGVSPLQACRSDDGGAFVVDLGGSPVTYRPR